MRNGFDMINIMLRFQKLVSIRKNPYFSRPMQNSVVFKLKYKVWRREI